MPTIQTTKGKYTGQLNSQDQPHGLGYLEYNSSQNLIGSYGRAINYWGQFKAGQPHGFGKFQFHTGDLYRGHVKEGRPFGDGEMIFSRSWEDNGQRFLKAKDEQILPEPRDNFLGKFGQKGLGQGWLKNIQGDKIQIEKEVLL